MDQETIRKRKENKLSGNCLKNMKFTNLENNFKICCDRFDRFFFLTKSVKSIATEITRNLLKWDYFIKFDPICPIIDPTRFGNLNPIH